MPKQPLEEALVSSVLDRLLDDDPRAGDPSVQPLDVRDPEALAAKLKSPSDPVSRHINGQLLPSERETLESYAGGKPTVLVRHGFSPDWNR